jgi:hypothetical protein
METRPLSKLKRWRLVEIVARAATRQVLASTTPAQENPNIANP